MKNSIFAISASVVLTSGLQASTLIENFESYVAPLGSTMNGLGNWTVTNGITTFAPSSPAAVASLETAGWVGGDSQAAIVGGWEQTSLGLTSMSYNGLSVPFINSISPAVGSSFLIETQLVANTMSSNPFSIVLSASSGNLLTIDFVQNSATAFDLSWSSGLAGQAPIQFATLGSGILTSFRLDVFATGPLASDVGFAFRNDSVLVDSGALTASQTDTINGLNINWDSTGGAGSSYIVVDNISVIPEPSAALLGLLGSSFLLLRRRKA